jgi:hypothetical protein
LFLADFPEGFPQEPVNQTKPKTILNHFNLYGLHDWKNLIHQLYLASELRILGELHMPEKQTVERARKAERKGKSASTQAGEFVRERCITLGKANMVLDPPNGRSR